MEITGASLEIIRRLALALAIGLLVGIERGWKQRARAAGTRTGGVRTFAIMGLGGGVAAALSQQAGQWVLPASILVIGGAFAVYSFEEERKAGTHSVTGTVAAVITILLGAFAVAGDELSAAMAAIAMTVILAAREALHAWVSRLTWEELRSGLLLLVMSIVLLPFLPDRAIDPWAAVNPREVWLLTVVIAGLSSIGYYAIKIAGPRWGPLLAGAAGGLISSTAVTVAFSRIAKKQPEAAPALALGAAMAGTLAVIRPAIIVLFLAPSMIKVLAPVLLPAAIAFGLAAAAVAWIMRKGFDGNISDFTPRNPFDLREALQFGGLLGAVMLLSRLLNDAAGPMGLIGIAVVTGLADIDAMTLSAAKLSQGEVTPRLAAYAIFAAVVTNGMVKLTLGGVLGGRAFASILGAASSMGLVVGLAAAKVAGL